MSLRLSPRRSRRSSFTLPTPTAPTPRAIAMAGKAEARRTTSATSTRNSEPALQEATARSRMILAREASVIPSCPRRTWQARKRGAQSADNVTGYATVRAREAKRTASRTTRARTNAGRPWRPKPSVHATPPTSPRTTATTTPTLFNSSLTAVSKPTARAPIKFTRLTPIVEPPAPSFCCAVCSSSTTSFVRISRFKSPMVKS